MEILDWLLSIFVKILPLKFLIRISGKKIVLPFYHTVSDIKLPHVYNLYPVRSIEQFQNDVKVLLEYFIPVNIQDIESVKNGKLVFDKPIFHLSFDDGLRETFSHVLPLLTKLNLPATIFINTNFIDNKQLFYRFKLSLIAEEINKLSKKDQIKLVQVYPETGTIEKLLGLSNELKIQEISKYLKIDFSEYLKHEKPYLTISEVNNLIENKFTIGSHSASHPLFSAITLSEQKSEIMESFNYLEDNFDIKHRYFSFPYTSDGVSSEFMNWLDKENIISFGTSNLNDSDFSKHYHRIGIESKKGNMVDILKLEMTKAVIKRVIRFR